MPEIDGEPRDMPSLDRTPSRQELIAAITSLRPWQRGHERAPHKPLLLLWALARVQQGGSPRIHFMEVEEPLTRLLREFGPARRTYHPEHPFWHLRTDGIWSVDRDDDLRVSEGKGSPSAGAMRRIDATAGFVPQVQALLGSDPTLVRELATLLLESHFPESMHEEIASAVGLDLTETVTRRAGRRRDPAFREKVLRAYERACAVCAMAIRFDDTTVALDAAHIHWHTHGGADEVWNGIALCVLHHRLFDRGVFTLDEGLRVMVSELVERSRGAEEALLRFQGVGVRRPEAVGERPAEEVVGWHRREVFRGR